MNKRNIVGTLAVFMLLLIAIQTVTAQSPSAKDLLKEGDNYLKQGNYDRAIESYESILNLYPNSSQAKDAKKKLEDKKLVAHREEKQREEQRKAQEELVRQERAAREQQQREAAEREREAAQRRGFIRLNSEVNGTVLINGEASAYTAVEDISMDITVEDALGKTFTLAVRDSKGTVFQASSPVTFAENPSANTPLVVNAAIRDPNPPANSGDDFDIRQNNQGGITITKYKGSRQRVVIPETIEGIKVTEIGDGAFSKADGSVPLLVSFDNYSENVGRFSPIKQDVYTVLIPNTVTAIRGRAFKGQPLREVRIGNSVKTIGSEAFCDCKLTSLTIPNSVTVIGLKVFANNAINSLSLGNGLVEIMAGTFQNNALTELSLPSSLRTIGSSAFQDNKITSLTIPRGVTSLGSDAFANVPTKMGKIFVGGSPTITTVSIPSSLTYFEKAFGSNNEITTITIGANADAKNLTQFGNDFSTFYESQGKKAGTYTWSGRIWTVK